MASSLEKLPQINSGEKSGGEREVSRAEILEMSPKELVGFFDDLQRRGKLEPFLEKLAEDESLTAAFSYWEKWLEEDKRRLLDQVIAKKRDVYGEAGDSLPLRLDKKFSGQELELILGNLKAIQLTFGCSKGCVFCGVDAVPKVREHIPYSELANLFQKYGNLLAIREPILYWASEPSDYASREGLKDRTYRDVHQLAKRYAGYSPYITSREFSDLKWLKFLGTKGRARLSVYGLDEQKIGEIEGATSEKDIEIAGRGQLHRKGLGLSYGKNLPEMQTIGIGGLRGVLLTPRGLYNIVQIKVSEKFPQGQTVVPIESLSDKEPKVGDSLNKVLQRCVVHYGAHTSSVSEINSIEITQKSGKYLILFDKDGIIIQITKI